MKLAFCLFKYFPYGGLQRDFFQLARTCLHRGHQVDVYTGSWKGEQPNDLRVFIVPNRRLTNHRRYVSFARRANKLIAQEGYDAVVGFNKMPGIDVYFASDSCYVARAMEKSFLYRISGRCRTLTAMEKAVFGRESKTEIISISENEKQRYMDYYGTEESRFHCVPPGISKKRLAAANAPETRSDLRREFSADQNTNIVLMVGSGFKTKGVDRAIRAISALPGHLKEKTLLLIVGKGKTGPYLRLAKRLGVLSNIYFMGQRDDVPRFLAGADLLLHPACHENTGTVLIEAMAAGLPVLATENCGYASHIERAGAGKLVPSPFNQETLNSMLASVLSDKQMEQWRENGKKYVAETDVYSMHQKAADVIEMVAAGRGFS